MRRQNDMKRRSDNVDLVLLAIVVSLALHAGLMFFAAPQVMSRIGASSAEPSRHRRPPMSVRKFAGDPLREREKTRPKSDVPAPKSAPQVGAIDAGAAPAAVPAAQMAVAAPVKTVFFICWILHMFFA